MKPIFKVLKPGIFSSFQDLGRPGYARFGISQGGSIDSALVLAANYQVGNPSDATVIEGYFQLPELECMSSVIVAFQAVEGYLLVDDKKFDYPVKVEKGQILRGHISAGCYGYLAVSGGIKAEKFMGSASFHSLLPLRGKIHEEELIYGNIHPVRSKSEGLGGLKKPDYHLSNILIYPGPEFDHFARQPLVNFLSQDFTVQSSSNRMAVGLHASVPFSHQLSILSSAVLPGTIQLFPSGQISVVGVDGQTVGGYPRIGIIAPEFWSIFAQKRSGEKVNFQFKF